MTTLVPLDHRYQNREEVPLDRRPSPGEAAVLRAMAPLGDEWQLSHWHRWTVVVPFVDVDRPDVRELIVKGMDSIRASSDPEAYTPPPPGPPSPRAVLVDGDVVPELDNLPGTADFPIAEQSVLAQTTLTYRSRTDRSELSVMATFTPEGGAAGAAFRRVELGSAPDRSSPAGTATAVGNVAAVDAGTTMLMLTLDEPGGLVSDLPSARLEAIVARLAPVA